MWLLLGTTITTSFFDSLNPSAIAQQMLLQAMVKKKRHMVFYFRHRLGKSVYGAGDLLWNRNVDFPIGCKYHRSLSHLCLAAGAGAICLLAGIRLIGKTRISNKAGNDNEEAETVKAPVRLSPVSLFIMGAAFCFVELTSAFPYFGFIALLTQYRLAFPLTLFFMLIYNFMYILPLILLYFGYNKLQGTRAIKKLERILGKISSYIVPVVVALVGVLLVYYGISSLL